MGIRLAVFACGNSTRGDDALGLALLARVEAVCFPGVETREDFQFQIEHTLDLQQADLALFLDAATNTDTPISFYEVDAASGSSMPSTHALAPADLLAVYLRAFGKAPPPAFVLAVKGDDFKLGEGLTQAAQGRLDAAWPFLRDLCAAPDAARWRRLVGAVGTGGG